LNMTVTKKVEWYSENHSTFFAIYEKSKISITNIYKYGNI